MRTLYIRFMLPIIAILIVATVLVLMPMLTAHTGVAPTSQHHTAAPTQLEAKGYSH